jgi:hypothetical protein
VPEIELRAFRGSRRSSTYRAHEVGAEAAAQIGAVATSAGLTELAGAVSAADRELDKRSARVLADEATRLRMTARVLELDDDLTAIAEVANWCGRAAGRAWLQVRTLG